MTRPSLYLILALILSCMKLKAQNTYPWPNTGNIGIGTTSPTYSLHLKGNDPALMLESTSTLIKSSAIRGNGATWIIGTVGEPGVEDIRIGTMGGGSRTLSLFTGGLERMRIQSNGAVGIGLSNPAAILHVKTGAQNILFGTGSCISSYSLSLGVNDDGVNISNNSIVRGFRFKNGNGLLMDISPGGSVGVGAPAETGYKFSVNGDALFTKVKVKTYANWPDFVFEEKYALPTLYAVEKYLETHKCLPGIPSAAEVAAGGLDLAEMNAKLLQKVEELTLYLIEQNKKLELQQRQIDSLKKQQAINPLPTAQTASPHPPSPSAPDPPGR